MSRLSLIVAIVLSVVLASMVADAGQSPSDIYHKVVWPATLQLRAANPTGWYNKLPELYAKFRKQYGSQWKAIMSYGETRLT
ncbi:hypothetical protein ONE63_002832 [Megalurothrips usitatus]|uniref:Uncharacterized protein n=1 Tax=Megalurothrips usitatus TaxID=439358 RepID=A0AAV7XC24_9NEOP|nr:hypothetical protein ONE63_002832 [Megalurothrips usitatus]